MVQKGEKSFMNNVKTQQKSKFTESTLWKQIVRYKFLYLLLLPAVVTSIIFQYGPMPGIRMAFQDYKALNPSASQWVGLKHFISIFQMPETMTAIKNTMTISLLNLVIAYPLTIVFALLLNELRNAAFKKVVQTISYLPHFLSWISVIGIITSLYAEHGMINDLLVKFTGGAWERESLLAKQAFFIPDVLILSIWKSLGWSSIVFLAAITGIDQGLYEAAMIDGASKIRRVWHITIPGILPTIMIMLLWKMAALFADNFELIFGLQNAYVNVEVIGTYVFKKGIQGGKYDIATAFGLMQGLINFSFLLVSNWISKKLTDVGMF